MKRNAYRELASDLLVKWGVEHSFGKGGKHPFVEVRNGSQRLKLGFPYTPSDHRGIRNFETRLRSNVQALGLSTDIPATKRKASSRQMTAVEALPPLLSEARQASPEMAEDVSPLVEPVELPEAPPFDAQAPELREAAAPVRPSLYPRLPPLPPFARLPDEDDPKYRRRRYLEQPEYRERVQEYNRRAKARRDSGEVGGVIFQVPQSDAPPEPAQQQTPIPEQKPMPQPDNSDLFAEARLAFELRLTRALKLRDASSALLDVIADEPDAAPWKLIAEGLATMLDAEAGRLTHA